MSSKPLTCEFCEKGFSCRQSKAFHIKNRCKVIRQQNLDHAYAEIEKLNSTIATQQKALDNLLGNPINPIIPSNVLVVNSHDNTNYHNNTNSHNTINTINNTNITFACFRKEDLSYIKHEVIRDLIKSKDLYKSLQDIIKLTHFNESHPENMNIYVQKVIDQNGKESFRCFLYRKGKWTEMPLKELAYLVIINSATNLEEHHDEPYDKEYTEDEDESFDRFTCNTSMSQTLEDTIKTLCCPINRAMVERGRPDLPSTLPRAQHS